MQTYLNIEPGSYGVAQRVEAVERAAALSMGVTMAVGNVTTRFYADTDVPVGKVAITMPPSYKAMPEYVRTLDSPEEDWCPRESDTADHARWRECTWCGRGPLEEPSASYTPTDEQVRGVYQLGLLDMEDDIDVDVTAALEQFDRWLARVREQAWDECLDAIDSNELNTDQAREGNPYRTTSDDSGSADA